MFLTPPVPGLPYTAHHPPSPSLPSPISPPSSPAFPPSPLPPCTPPSPFPPPPKTPLPVSFPGLRPPQRPLPLPAPPPLQPSVHAVLAQIHRELGSSNSSSKVGAGILIALLAFVLALLTMFFFLSWRKGIVETVPVEITRSLPDGTRTRDIVVKSNGKPADPARDQELQPTSASVVQSHDLAI